MNKVNNFKKGDKVVPIGDSVYVTLDESVAWERARKIGQPFLYVDGFGYDEKKEKYYVTVKEKEYGGWCSFFEKENLKHYEESKVEVKDDQEKLYDSLECRVDELTTLIAAGILLPEDIVWVRRKK